MSEYQAKSFEELRLEDYAKGNKGGSAASPFGAPAGAGVSPFGAPAQNATNHFAPKPAATLFGAPAALSGPVQKEAQKISC